MKKQTHLGLLAAAALLLAACGPAEQPASTAVNDAPVESAAPVYPPYQASVDASRLISADSNPVSGCRQAVLTGNSVFRR